MFSTRSTIFCLIFLTFCISQINAAVCKDAGVICHHFRPSCAMSEDAKNYCPVTCNTCPEEGACKDENGGCAHECESVEDVAVCSCYKGYRLDTNGKDCIDINECLETPDICGAEMVCENYGGIHECLKKRRCERQGLVPKLSNSQCCTPSTPDSSAGACGKDPHVDPTTMGSGLSLIVDARIVGGKVATRGAWPWMTYILINKRTLCGGTLIDRQWVLTAGHCFMKKHADMEIELFFGLDTVKEKDAGHVRKRKGVEVILHENWNSTYYPYRDLALIKLDRPIDNTVFVYPVCLPHGERPKPGYKCWVIGYGTTSYRGTASKKLRQVDVPIRNQAECVRAYKDTKFPINPDLMFCAGYDKGGKDACQGDSGGPLVCQRCESCGWYIYGVTSFGYKCAERNYYGVYTNIEVFEGWISEKIGRPLRKDQTCDGPTKENLWASWGEWTVCSRTCGGGNQTRSRICIGGKAGVDGCPGEDGEVGVCEEQPCPTWEEWGAWTTCSRTCGKGNRKRERGCSNGIPGESGCDNGDTLEPQSCNEQECPVWSEWANWSECTQTCDGGERKTSRTCSNGTPGDVGCEGDNTKSEVCNNSDCPPQASWTEWTEWQQCSTSCNGGSSTRARFCQHGQAGEEGCLGYSENSKPCNEQCCCLAEWGEWSSWTECSTTCGYDGVQLRLRMCQDIQNPDNCVGDSQLSRPCQSSPCKDILTASWMEWTTWGDCSVTCGKGNSQRMRVCSTGTPGECLGDFIESEPCNDKPCSVVGEWGDWGECSVKCGMGDKVRRRECLGPGPCEDELVQSEKCIPMMCEAKWSEWSDYSECSRTCGNGTKSRTRQCMFGAVGDQGCEGSFFEMVDCYHECKGMWAAWGAFTSCSQRCNGGLKRRSRACEGGEMGEPGCSPVEDSSEEVVCNLNGCSDKCVDLNAKCALYVRYNPSFCTTWKQYTKVHCMKSCPEFCTKPGPWLSWSECSKTCEGGHQERRRNCQQREGCEPVQRRMCNEQKCSGFTHWSAWGECSASCGDATRTRTRTCADPTGCTPDNQYGLATEDTGPCPLRVCPGTWASWLPWKPCSSTCGAGIQSRSRICIGGLAGGLGCEGLQMEPQECNVEECVGSWSRWRSITQCSATCGDGSITESRHCTDGVVGGAGCKGELTRTMACFLKECVVMWTQWSDWASCDRDCGGGTQERIRFCDNGEAGNPGCEGKMREMQQCNTEQCNQEESCKGFADQTNMCSIYTHLCTSNHVIRQHCLLTCCKQMSNVECQNILPDARCAIYARESLCSFNGIAQNCRKSCNNCA